MPATEHKRSSSVLIVDDTPANLIALEAVLKPLGTRVVSAVSGQVAIESVERESFAVAVLDVQMPGMDGFQVAERFRRMENGRELPIIFLTAIQRDEAFAKRAYAGGAADFITKPFDVDILRARVRAFVDLFERREQVRMAQVALRTRERDDAMKRLAGFERIATAALDDGDDLAGFLQKLLDVFLDVAETADSARILLRVGNRLRLMSWSSREGALERPLSIEIGSGFLGKVASSRTPAELSGASDSPLLEGDWHRERHTNALYCVPLMHDGELLGVADFGSRTTSALDDGEKRLFGALTERAAWAVAKRAERVRMRDVIATAPSMIAILRNADMKLTFANAAYRSLLGVRDPLETTLGDLSADPPLVAAARRVIESGKAQRLEDVRIERASAAGAASPQETFIDVTLQTLLSPTGEPDELLLLAVDVSGRVLARRVEEAHAHERAALLESERAARGEAERANRTKDEFLATVSHELRTPLNAILGWAAMIRSDASSDVHRALEVIERNAKAQARIIDDVLDVSRIVSGTLRLERVDVSTLDVLSASLDTVRPLAKARNVSLNEEIGPLRRVIGDAERLRQVITNVVSNAIKFTPSGGSVNVAAGNDDGHVFVRVADTGEGIAPSFLPHLFEAFRQADGTASRRHAGLGLGLAIAQQLVNAHGGSITAESEGLGRGAVFTVRLPCAKDSDRPPARRRSTSEAEGEVRELEGLSIVVVEDQEDSRELLAAILEARGASVESVDSGEAALELIPRVRPDVIVSDIGMPGMDGLTLIREVRRIPASRGGSTPAIALTAYVHPDDRKRALAAGFDRHLGKPVKADLVASTIVSLVEAPGRRAD